MLTWSPCSTTNKLCWSSDVEAGNLKLKKLLIKCIKNQKLKSDSHIFKKVFNYSNINIKDFDNIQLNSYFNKILKPTVLSNEAGPEGTIISIQIAW